MLKFTGLKFLLIEGSHTLDLFDFLFGPLIHVQGDAVTIASGLQLSLALFRSFFCSS